MMHIAKRLSDLGDLKKRPHLSPEKYFLAKNKLEQSYDYTRRLDKKYSYLPLKRTMALHLNKLESLLFKDVLCQSWLSGSGEEF